MEEANNNIPLIVDVTTDKDGVSATDHRGIKYKIESVMLGVGSNRKPVKHTKNFLSVGGDYRAEVLPNGKLNIIG